MAGADAEWDEWFAALFGPEGLQAKKTYGWPLGGDDEACCARMTTLFERAGTLLQGVSDDRVAEGLDFLLNPSLSNWGPSAVDPSVPLAVRARYVRSVLGLFEGVFLPRLGDASGAPARPPPPPLGRLCYGFFDTTPLLTWTGPEGSEVEEESGYEAWSLLGRVLLLPSHACAESSLEGMLHYSFVPTSWRSLSDILARLPRRAVELTPRLGHVLGQVCGLVWSDAGRGRAT